MSVPYSTPRPAEKKNALRHLDKGHSIWTHRTTTASVGRRQDRLDASRPGIRELPPDAVLEVFIQRSRRPPHAHMRQTSVKSACPVIKPPTQRAHDPAPPQPFLMPQGSPERGSAMLQNSRCPPDAEHPEKPKKLRHAIQRAQLAPASPAWVRTPSRRARDIFLLRAAPPALETGNVMCPALCP